MKDTRTQIEELRGPHSFPTDPLLQRWGAFAAAGLSPNEARLGRRARAAPENA